MDAKRQKYLDILNKIFEPDFQDCQTPEQDLQLAITLNPDLNRILDAMDMVVNEFKQSQQKPQSEIDEKSCQTCKYDMQNNEICIGCGVNYVNYVPALFINRFEKPENNFFPK